MSKITAKEMLEYLDRLEKGLVHKPFCCCSKCEKETEKFREIDIKEILTDV